MPPDIHRAAKLGHMLHPTRQQLTLEPLPCMEFMQAGHMGPWGTTSSAPPLAPRAMTVSPSAFLRGHSQVEATARGGMPQEGAAARAAWAAATTAAAGASRRPQPQPPLGWRAAAPTGPGSGVVDLGAQIGDGQQSFVFPPLTGARNSSGCSNGTTFSSTGASRSNSSSDGGGGGRVSTPAPTAAPRFKMPTPEPLPPAPAGAAARALVGPGGGAELRLGTMGGAVGLLPALRPAFMDAYEVRLRGPAVCCHFAKVLSLFNPRPLSYAEVREHITRPEGGPERFHGGAEDGAAPAAGARVQPLLPPAQHVRLPGTPARRGRPDGVWVKQRAPIEAPCVHDPS